MAAVIAGTAGLALVLLIVAGRRARRRYVVITVEGRSMQPTLQPGARVLVRRDTPVASGALVVFERPRLNPHRGWHWPSRPDTPDQEWMLKRVVAVGGERVPEALRRDAEVNLGDLVPAGHIAVMSDNPRSSLDSRHIGHVPADRILGVVRRPG